VSSALHAAWYEKRSTRKSQGEESKDSPTLAPQQPQLFSAQLLAASVRAHPAPPQTCPSSMSSCTTATPTQPQPALPVVALSRYSSWCLATIAQSPEHPSALTKHKTQISPPTVTRAPLISKNCFYSGTLPGEALRGGTRNPPVTLPTGRAEQTLCSKPSMRAREGYFGISYVSRLQVDTGPEANAINGRREIGAGALLQHNEDVFRAGHVLLYLCARAACTYRCFSPGSCSGEHVLSFKQPGTRAPVSHETVSQTGHKLL